MRDGIMVWVEASDKSCCLYADELIGEQQVVVKPLPQFVSIFDLKSRGISGCTILGDGTISIILDVLGVYNAAIENA
jgi:two-component system chemotaxis sensor kinase CheA